MSLVRILEKIDHAKMAPHCIELIHISRDQNRESILTEAEAKLMEIQLERWRLIAEELRGQDPYQFLRAYSPGKNPYRWLSAELQ